MSREIETVALAIYTQLAHQNIDQEQADKLVATIVSGWQFRDVPFDREAFEALALKGIE